MIPFEAETIDRLRARYRAAIAQLLDPLTMTVAPGQKREHVFDSKDGIRLIISREQFDDGPAIHISASVQDKSPLASSLEGGMIHPKRFLKKCVERWQQISGDRREPRLILITPGKGIPHWHLKDGGRK